jgi:hypothetical protein
LSTPLNSFDAVSIGTIAVAIATVVLAVITYFYMRETRLMRKSAEKPSFSLEPTLYVIGGQFYFLHLVNTGHTGSEIHVNCSWEDKTKKFFILSLGTNGRAFLHDIPIAEIVEKKLKISVNIRCKDSRNNPYKQDLEIDFKTYLDTDTKVAYQFNYLGNMVETLDEIRKELRNVDKSLIESILSYKPYLHIDCKIANNPQFIGNSQEIEVTISGIDNKHGVVGALIILKLITPGGSQYTSEALTDENGKIVMNYDINKIYEIGRYKLVIWVTAENYRRKAITTDFTAVERQYL